VTRYEIAPACRVAASPGSRPAAWSPWLEAALSLRVTVPEWQHDEGSWAHWAAPAGDPAAAPRRYDPGRFAVVAGAPDAAAAGTAPAGLDEVAARGFVERVLAGWRPALHRQSSLGLVSRLDEPREEFRRRCLALLRPLLSGGGADREAVAARMAKVAAGIESLVLEAGRLEVRHARVAVVWYPDGRVPAVPVAELMVGGAARGAR
jgi:hypothetical protein